MNDSPRADWLSRNGGWLAGLVIAVVLLAWGAINYVAGLKPPQPHAITIAALEAAQPLPGRWLEVTGQLLREDRIIWNGPDTRETYVPLVAPDWQPFQPVAVFVRARESDWGQPGRLLHHQGPAVVGTVDRSGLDPDLAARFTAFGMPPRPDVIVLDYEAEPSSQSLILGYVGFGLGGLALLITTVARLSPWFRSRNAAGAKGANE